jgi:hypothetical protein
MKIFLVGLLAFSSSAFADLLPPPAQVTIKGPEATQVAELLPSRSERGAMTSNGNASVSCAKRGEETDYTCVISIERGRHSVREPQGTKKDSTK